MDTIGMDTYPLVALVTGTATGVFTQLDPVLRRAWAKAASLQERFYSPRRAGKRRCKGPLANAHSVRDNWGHRSHEVSAAEIQPSSP